MNTSFHPEIVTPCEADPQASLPLETQGVLRHVWESRFGPMLIEVRDGRAYVNGQRVEPADPENQDPRAANRDPHT